MTISPKDKCPCGSGRKYKKCCGLNSAANYEEQLERNYRLFRCTEVRLADKALTVLHSLGDEALEDAHELFFGDMPEPEPKTQDSVMQMFVSFLLFDYPAFEKDPSIKEGKSSKVSITSLADLFLVGGAKLSIRKDELLFLQAGVKSQFSWYLVEEVRQGMEVTVRDLLDSQIHKVREHSATEVLQPGACIFARVIEVFGVKGFFGCYPILLPPQAMADVLDMCDHLPKGIKMRQEAEPQLSERVVQDIVRRESFIDLAQAWEQRLSTPTEIRNTDGDKLEFLTVEWRFSAALRDIIEGLKPLIEGPKVQQDDNVLQQLSRIERGELREINFCWHKESESRGPVVVAQFALQRGKIVAQVNSRERAENVQTEVARLLGEKVKLKGIKKVKPSRSGRKGKDIGVLTAADLEKNPEVRAKVEEMAEAHWERWFETPVPMLENQTPRQAATSERGRELLKALFHHYQALQAKSAATNLFNPDISALKARLGLLDLQ